MSFELLFNGFSSIPPFRFGRTPWPPSHLDSATGWVVGMLLCKINIEHLESVSLDIPSTQSHPQIRKPVCFHFVIFLSLHVRIFSEFLFLLLSTVMFISY